MPPSIDPDKIEFIVERMREIEEEDLIEAESGDDGDEPHIDLDHEEAFDELESHGEHSNPVMDELMSFLEALGEDEQIELVALAWTGRGDYDASEWEEAVSAAEERHNDQTAHYLVGMPRLADYLEEAQEILGGDEEEE